jgi:23S rRNA (cytosine1962-C5)-methyltransferase
MNLSEQRKPQRLSIRVKPAAERMVKKGHPWVFADSISKQNSTGEAGDIVVIYDNNKNKFLACGLYDPHSPIRVKLLQFHQPAMIDEQFFATRIQEAFARRKPLLDTDNNSYRFIYGENDGLPSLIADVYDSVLVLKIYSAIWLPYLNEILPALVQHSRCKAIVLRLSRSLMQLEEKGDLSDGQVLWGTLDNEEVLFKECGLLFAANVIAGHKTGYFLDQRHNRQKIGAAAKGKKMLDVFAYAGGFSVHALAGGATEVTSIDVSAKALQMAQKNAALNAHQGIHHTKTVDAFVELEAMAQRREAFDIVVIDPPSFAKQASEVERARRHYLRLAKLGAQVLSPGGLLFLASCSSRVSADNFFALCAEGIGASKQTLELKEKTFHDLDHPITFAEGAYLKAGYWSR